MTNGGKPISASRNFQSRLRKWLIEPHPSFQDVQERRRAEFLSILTLVLSSAYILGVIFSPRTLTTLLVLAIPSVITLICYGLTRTRYLNAGLYILLTMICLSGYIGVYTSTNKDTAFLSLITVLPIAYVLGSGLLSQRGMVVMFLVTIVTVFLLPMTGVIGGQQAGIAGGSLIPVGFLLIVVSSFRQRVEREQMAALRVSNEDLTLLSGSLEKSVIERTASAETARAEAEAARAESESARNALENQVWLATGQTQLADAMRGEQTLSQLAENVISQLCQYTGIQAGALFLLNEKTLTLAGRYAFAERPGFSGKFQLGEGLVGQVAADGKVISLQNIPSDTLVISTGLADLKPRQIAAAPFRANGEIVGVIELATLSVFTKTHLELWNCTSESIGVAFITAQTRQRLADLLEESQQQAEELQAQDEELRAANEELHAQAENLKAAREFKIPG